MLTKTVLNNVSYAIRGLLVALMLSSVTPFVYAQALTEKTVEITTADQFTLSAQLFSAAPSASGVLFLHDCQHSAQDYQPLYAALVKQGFTVLALDLRGYGDSQSELFSEQKIRRQSEDIVSYQGQLAGLMLHWQKDVLSALHYMQQALGNKQAISVVTSGCSSNQAIYLAETNAINSIVMFAPELSSADKEQFKQLSDMPIYLLSSKHQTEAMLNAKELFDWSGDKNTVLQVLKGNLSAYQLLKQQPYLNEHVATWLRNTLKGH